MYKYRDNQNIIKKNNYYYGYAERIPIYNKELILFQIQKKNDNNNFKITEIESQLDNNKFFNLEIQSNDKNHIYSLIIYIYNIISDLEAKKI
jgi:hypothetical protein